MLLPEEYTISKFFQFTYRPTHNRYNNTYQGGCCICREGGSLGKKRRCYYIPKNDNIFCHNCGWSSKPFKWLKEVSGMNDSDIFNEIRNEDFAKQPLKEDIEAPKIVTESLPKDCINLFDEQQIKYYKSNPIVTAALNVIQKRRLTTAVNKTNSLYISLVDRVHKNRLVIPFFNEQGDIEFYQTRTIIPTENKTKPKYISKIGGEKTLFNIDKINSDYDTVYIFEGPLDAFFTKNSVATAGITERGSSNLTHRQQQQLDTTLKWYNKIWVLDSQWQDQTSLNKSEILLHNGEKVFVWPEKFGKKFKDFNDICIACKINEISHEFIEKNTFSNLEGLIRLSEIKRYVNTKQ